MRTLNANRRILAVGEGQHTEYNYFVGLRTVHAQVLAHLGLSLIVRRGSGGDARRIVNNAIKHLKNEGFAKNERRPGDRVFLVMDTEGPGSIHGQARAPELPAAENLAAKNGIEIIYSTPAFEYWLLSHFADLPRGHFGDCAVVLKELAKVWSTASTAGYRKNDEKVF